MLSHIILKKLTRKRSYLYMKAKTIKSLEENIRQSLCTLGVRNYFLDVAQKHEP